MAKMEINVAKEGSAHIPEELRKEGFVGKVEGISNAFTLVLIKPGTPLIQVKRSLRLVIRDIDLRISMGQEM